MKVIALVFKLGPLVLVAVAVMYVLNIGGARQPMADAYFGFVAWLIEPVADSFREQFEPKPTPEPSARVVP